MTALDVVDVAYRHAHHQTGGCQRPIRLVGGTTRVDTSTGEVLDSYRSADEVDGITWVRCGDRRAARCPSCAHEYKGDAWHLLHAGLAGGKGTPEVVADHPALFVTLTAPSFGYVHGLRQRGPCRGRRDHPTCGHGRPLWCSRRHQPDDPCLGEPLCVDCYDYPGHVLWQWWAPELWRRTTITIGRYLTDELGAVRRGPRPFKVAYSKVAEFQARGVVHFHIVMRLDGPDGPDSAPPDAIDVDVFERVVTDAVRATTLIKGRVLRWGDQLDIRPIIPTADRNGRHGAIHPEQVAAYLAKYLTKSTEDFGLTNRVRSLADVRHARAHVQRIIRAAQHLTALGDDYQRLRDRYATLGYRGHPITKTRRWSTTFARLRQARRTYRQRSPGPRPDIGDDIEPLGDDHDTDETVIVVRHWQFHGVGYLTAPEAIAAVRSAARARTW